MYDEIYAVGEPLHDWSYRMLRIFSFGMNVRMDNVRLTVTIETSGMEILSDIVFF